MYYLHLAYTSINRSILRIFSSYILGKSSNSTLFSNVDDPIKQPFLTENADLYSGPKMATLWEPHSITTQVAELTIACAGYIILLEI